LRERAKFGFVYARGHIGVEFLDLLRRVMKSGHNVGNLCRGQRRTDSMSFPSCFMASAKIIELAQASEALLRALCGDLVKISIAPRSGRASPQLSRSNVPKHMIIPVNVASACVC